MREVPLHKAKDDLSKYLRDAEKEEIIITRHGKPAGCLSDSLLRMIGLSIALSTIRDFFAGSPKHVAGSLLERASSSKRLIFNDRVVGP